MCCDCVCLCGMPPTVAAGFLQHAAGTKLKTLMSCLITHQKVPCSEQRDQMRSLEVSPFSFFGIPPTYLGGIMRRDCKGYVKSKQSCQALLCPSVVGKTRRRHHFLQQNGTYEQGWQTERGCPNVLQRFQMQERKNFVLC